MEDALLNLFSELLRSLAKFLPNMLISLLVLLLGYLVGRLTGRAVEGAVKLVKGDERFRSSELGRRLTEAGYPISRILAMLTRAVIYVLTITAAISILNIPPLQEFSTTIASYLPRLIGAVIIFLLGAMLVEWLAGLAEGLMRGGAVSDRMVSLLSAGLKYIFYVILVFMTFEIAGIAPQVVSSVALAIFVSLAMGAGLALALLVGLGLREDAAVILFNEPKGLREGIVIEVEGVRGRVRRVATLYIVLENENGVFVIPRRKLLKNGFRILDQLP